MTTITLSYHIFEVGENSRSATVGFGEGLPKAKAHAARLVHRCNEVTARCVRWWF